MRALNSKLVMTIAAMVCLQIPVCGFAQVDGRFIPESAAGALIIHPAVLAKQEGLQLLPHEIITAFGEKELGVDPMKIDQAIALIDKPTQEHAPGWGVIVRFAEPMFLSREFLSHFEVEDFNGMKMYSRPPDQSILVVDQRTFLAGTPEFVGKMANANTSDSPLMELIATGYETTSINGFLAFGQVRDFITRQLEEEEDVPPPLQPFLEIPQLLESVIFRQDINGRMTSRLTIVATDAAKAEKLDDLMQRGVQMAKQMLLGELASQMDMDDPVQEASLKYAYRLGDFLQEQLKPTRQGNELVYEADQGIASAPILAGLLLPAVQQARSAARRVHSANNLRQLILAMHNCHDTMKRLPTNIYDEDGNALLSWRVQVLPFIEEGELYSQFKLDEPWDSEHNLKLVERMPEILRCPDVEVEPGKTIYVEVSGKGMVFDGPKRTTLESIYDGTSRTIALVEANPAMAVIWTKPEGIEFNPSEPKRGIGGFRSSGFNVAFLDGSIHHIAETISLETLRQLLMPNDGSVPTDY